MRPRGRPASPSYASGARRRLGRDLRAAQADSSARILPEFLLLMQGAESARNAAEVVFGAAFGNICVVERLGAHGGKNSGGQLALMRRAAVSGRPVRLAGEIIIDLRAIGVGVSDALVI